MIEGDIKGFFDNIDHHILANLLEKEVKDKNLIDLYWKLVRAGYVNNGVYQESNLGVPQGGILSPLLSNIYLHQFDLFMNDLIKKYSDDKPVSRDNKIHTRLLTKINGESKKKNPDTKLIRSMKIQLRSIPSIIRDENTGKRVYYNRFADDWVIGIIGSKALAEKIKAEVSEYLKNRLLISLSEEKTKITHLTSKKANYLGFQIFRRNRKYSESMLVLNKKSNTYKRGSNSRVMLFAPIDKLVDKLVEHKFAKRVLNNVKPVAITKWIYLEPYEIISRYNAILRGILNYYKPVDNRNQLSYIVWILRFSAAFTLARKWNISPAKVFTKLGKFLTIKITNAKGKESQVSFASPKTLARDRTFNLDNYLNFDPFRVKYYEVRSHHVWDEPCSICGSTDNVEMHHVKHVRKGKIVGFTALMSKLNRKQIPVCVNCHDKIHSGKYDGLSLKNIHLNTKKD